MLKVQALPQNMPEQERLKAILSLTADLFKVDQRETPRVLEFHSLTLQPKKD